MNQFLRQLEFNVSLSYGDLSDVTDVDKTATEVKIAKKRKYNMVSAIQENLKDCLKISYMHWLFTTPSSIADMSSTVHLRIASWWMMKRNARMTGQT